MNKMTEKTLQQRFLNGERLSLLDNIRLNLLRKVEDCDGMCGFNSACGYCEIYKNNHNIDK